MASQIKNNDLNNWYEQLNAIRTEFNLTTLSYSSIPSGKRVTSTDYTNYLDLLNTLKTNTYGQYALDWSSSTTETPKINNKINETTKNDIDNTIAALQNLCARDVRSVGGLSSDFSVIATGKTETDFTNTTFFNRTNSVCKTNGLASDFSKFTN